MKSRRRNFIVELSSDEEALDSYITRSMKKKRKLTQSQNNEKKTKSKINPSRSPNKKGIEKGTSNADKSSHINTDKIKLVKKKEKENTYSEKVKKSKAKHWRKSEQVLENVGLNTKSNKSGYNSDSDICKSDIEDSDSDIDVLFNELKKHGVKTDTSVKKFKKSNTCEQTKESECCGNLTDTLSSKKVKPELEKSPESLILTHKRISRKIFPNCQEEIPTKIRKKNINSITAEKQNSCMSEICKTPLNEQCSSLLSNFTKNFLRHGSDDNLSAIASGLSKVTNVEKENHECRFDLKSPNEKVTAQSSNEILSTPCKNDKNETIYSNITPKSSRKSFARCSVTEDVCYANTSKLQKCKRSFVENLNSPLKSDSCEIVHASGSPKNSNKWLVETVEHRTNRESFSTDTPKSHKYARSLKNSKASSYLADKSDFSNNSNDDHYGITSPSTPSSKRISGLPTTPLQKARTSLHVSSVPDSLPCREREFKNIYSFLENKLLDGIGGCMYISGVPGTGKSATVNQVIKKLQTLAEKDKIPHFKFIEINGMKIVDPRQAYILLWQGLTGKKCRISVDQAQRKLDAWFGKLDPEDKLPTVLLVDELDLICTRKQDVVYNLLDWPTKSPSRLIVIAIANTMDMPERLFKGRVTSRLGLTRLTFLPYTYKQLEEIVLTRLSGLDAFTLDAVRLVTRKVAAVSGDARRSLDICRRATELPEPNGTVTISHIEQAIKEMTNSNIVRVIRSCSQMEKLFLRSISEVSTRTGIEEVDMRDVMEHFLALSTLEGFSRLPVSYILSISNRLKCFRLIFVNSLHSGISQRLVLNVTQDDIHYGIICDTK